MVRALKGSGLSNQDPEVQRHVQVRVYRGKGGV
jgi:hypothetical protein